MADIEAMYHQVLVPDDQQTFLKFLWWSTDDIDDEPQDFMMCAHVFGGTSSASCSNYALRRTAIDNKEVYGTDAATTLLRNFYVDDLLKSMKNVQSAKQLVQNVRDMCKSGGFNLTKFISNSKELLVIIPDKKKKGWCERQRSFWRSCKRQGVRNMLGYRKGYVLLQDQFGWKAYNEKRFTINDKFNI